MADRPTERYPLTWPQGWARTPKHKRVHSSFKITPSAAFQDLMDELRRLGARSIILSSNLMLRADGAPYARQPKHDDEGIAVYFKRNGVEMALACDKYHRREENMRAISKTVDAIRGLERWGSSDMMERAFTGFTALPAPVDVRTWWQVLGVPEGTRGEAVREAFRKLRSKHHPDRAGDPAEFRAVQQAFTQAVEEGACNA